MVVDERVVYRVEACRAGEWWAITVPALAGVCSQARSVVEVEPAVREAIGLWLSAAGSVEVGEGDFDVEIDVRSG